MKDVILETIFEVLFERHKIKDLFITFIYRYRLCMIVFIITLISINISHISFLDNIEVIHNLSGKFNNLYMAWQNFLDESILSPIFEVIGNLFHTGAGNAFAIFCIIVMIWLIVFKGFVWGLAVSYLAYNGLGAYPVLIVAFILDIIINHIFCISKEEYY